MCFQITTCSLHNIEQNIYWNNSSNCGTQDLPSTLPCALALWGLTPMGSGSGTNIMTPFLKPWKRIVPLDVTCLESEAGSFQGQD